MFEPNLYQLQFHWEKSWEDFANPNGLEHYDWEEPQEVYVIVRRGDEVFSLPSLCTVTASAR